MKIKKDKLILCDLDGTLFDTISANFYSYEKALGKKNIVLNYDFFLKECYGKHYKKFLFKIGLNEKEAEEVHTFKKEIYVDYLKEIKINQQLFNILEVLKKEYHIGIVTTASKKNTEEVLNFFNKKELFELIISAEDVKNKKPNPEGYFKAMKFYNVSPENTLIFEDSDIGLKAAIATKASVLKVEKF